MPQGEVRVMESEHSVYTDAFSGKLLESSGARDLVIATSDRGFESALIEIAKCAEALPCFFVDRWGA